MIGYGENPGFGPLDGDHTLTLHIHNFPFLISLFFFVVGFRHSKSK